MQSTVWIFFVLAFLAACLGLSSMIRGKELFAETILNGTGIDVIEAACEVSTDVPGNVYRLSNVDALRRHPNVSNACYFATRDDAGLMDQNLIGCKRGSAIDNAGAVDALGVLQVLGTDECVVTLRPKQNPSIYQTYEKQLSDLAVERSQLYIDSMASFKAAQDTIALLRQQTAQANADLQAQTALYMDTLSRLVDASAKLDVLTASMATRTQQISDLTSVISSESITSAGYEAEIAQKKRAYDLAVADISSLQQQLQQLTSNIASLRVAQADRDSQIANLSNQLTSTNNTIAASNQNANAQVDSSNARMNQCNSQN